MFAAKLSQESCNRQIIQPCRHLPHRPFQGAMLYLDLNGLFRSTQFKWVVKQCDDYQGSICEVRLLMYAAPLQHD